MSCVSAWLGGWHGLLMPGASARYSCIGCRYGILVLCVGTVWVWRHKETLSRPTVEATDRQSDRPSKRPTVEATDRRSDRLRKRPTVEAVSKACAAVEAGSSVCTSLPAVSWRLARNVVKPYNCHQIHGFPLRRLFHVSRRVRSMKTYNCRRSQCAGRAAVVRLWVVKPCICHQKQSLVW